MEIIIDNLILNGVVHYNIRATVETFVRMEEVIMSSSTLVEAKVSPKLVRGRNTIIMTISTEE